MAGARKLSKDERREHQRALQRQAELEQQRARRSTRITKLVWMAGGVLLAAAAIFFAVRHSLNGAAGVSAQTVSANLGTPTNDIASPPTDGFSYAGAPLYQGGKPELLFIGAQYCPHCAGQRWAIVKALDQFGSFSNLTSTANDDGSIPTFDLRDGSYSSKYVAFDHKDLEDRNHNPLDTLSPDEQSIFSQYDPSGGIPLITVGGYKIIGDAYNIDDIQGDPFQTVQQGLQRHSGAFVSEINAEVNTLTAFLCHADRMQPAPVCGRSTIKRIVSTLR